ncbi:hypothetical protein P3T37_003538 [Kitasatospora sp. MAA4]|nr:hypothetical protein [Kitasatospora sp. MAA4]
MSLDISSRRENGWTVVHVEGELDIGIGGSRPAGSTRLVDSVSTRIRLLHTGGELTDAALSGRHPAGQGG